MAPRLPPKKTKASKRAPVLNFTSIDAALASAPSHDADDWLEEGERQENQGERYISGDKAERHYRNAIVSYRAAAHLVPTFDALYNAARVSYLLATDHLPAPGCYAALQEAIEGYRAALAVERNRGVEAVPGNVVDGLFNLAQALVAQLDMISESSAGSAGSGSVEARRAGEEAKTLFEEVEGSQMGELSKSTFGGSGGALAEDDADMAASASSSDAGGGNVQTAEAVETRVVTPAQVINTLLEAISLDISLFSSGSPGDTALLASASASLDRARRLRQLIPPSQNNADQDLQLSLAALRIATTSPGTSDTGALAAQFSALLRDPANASNPELLSDYGDFLVEALDSSNPLPPNFLALIEEATTSYLRVETLLSNRLSPPRHVPTYVIPSLLSANLTSQAYLALAGYHYFLTTSASKTPAALESASKMAASALSHLGPLEYSKAPYRNQLAFRMATLMQMRVALRGPGRPTRPAFLTDGELNAFVEDSVDDAVWRLSGAGVEQGWWENLAK